jgi:hypothetical protein
VSKAWLPPVGAAVEAKVRELRVVIRIVPRVGLFVQSINAWATRQLTRSSLKTPVVLRDSQITSVIRHWCLKMGRQPSLFELTWKGKGR